MPYSSACREKPPRRRLSQAFRFFSPPMSSTEKSTAMSPRLPMLPSNVRLASTSLGRSSMVSAKSS